MSSEEIIQAAVPYMAFEGIFQKAVKPKCGLSYSFDSLEGPSAPFNVHHQQKAKHDVDDDESSSIARAAHHPCKENIGQPSSEYGDNHHPRHYRLLFAVGQRCNQAERKPREGDDIRRIVGKDCEGYTSPCGKPKPPLEAGRSGVNEPILEGRACLSWIL